MLDIYGEPLPLRVWHGTEVGLPDIVRPAKAGQWWHQMDHDDYLAKLADEDLVYDPDYAEIDAELRLSYANLVFEALRTSARPEISELTKGGITALGEKVGILFVSGDQEYAGRWYGQTYEIDLHSADVLTAVPDHNLSPDRQSWILVLRAGAPFPKLSHAVAPTFDRAWR